ncbi:MAG: LuxR C-terminal-related transcriptional regulator [Gemmatimonadaceae bacterium]
MWSHPRQATDARRRRASPELQAPGYSNGGVARKLEVSPHTARRHTESVLLELDVHSRAEVAPKVLGTRRPSMPVRAV